MVQAKRMRKAKRAPKASKAVKPLNKVQKKQVISLVRGQAETKRAAFYQAYNDGTTPITARPTGLRSSRGFAVQNNAITNNTTDIHQLIPYVLQGLDDWSRIGTKIRPTSLIVNGTVRVNLPSYLNLHLPVDLKVVIYVLQSTQLRDYDGLWARNDFTNLLDTNEGQTVAFRGEAQDLNMPVSKQNYKLLQKKVLTLRYGGVTNTTGSNSFAVGIANAHTWYADYTMSLGKHLPATLVYPDNESGLPPDSLNSPTNSSIFMCMGAIDWYQGGLTNGGANDPPTPTNIAVKPWLEQTYVSHMSYKDI